MTIATPTVDPQLDLLLERSVDVPRALVWRAWTEPELVKRWFTPAPWSTAACEIDLRPGGVFRTVMRSPEGEEFDNAGCFLEIVEGRKLVWTGLLAAEFRPVDGVEGASAFTAVITLEDDGAGTRYSALAMHKNENGRRAHEEMGFHQGWGAALDQLVALTKNLT